MKRLPSATESSNGYVADLRIFKRAAKKSMAIPDVFARACRGSWVLPSGGQLLYDSINIEQTYNFILPFHFCSKNEWFFDDWILALVTQTGPKLKKTISFGATSVGGRPQRLGNVIIKLFKCQSLCFSVNPWPPACFSGKMGTNTVCLFQETNF